jgi:thiamine biosynthesis lipoprotein
VAEPARARRLVRVVPVMGTVFTLDVRRPLPAAGVIEQVIKWWRWVDETFSPFRPGSQVSRLNAGALRRRDCAEELIQVLALCEQANAATGGYFDAYASGTLDPSGLVKGWSVETASAMLAAAGSPNHCINGGGDIRCSGRPEPGWDWQVGIADPLRPWGVATIITVADGAVATSGIAERGHHVLNPRTRLPPSGLAGVTVTGADLTWADAYATAGLAMGGDAWHWICELDHHEGFIIYADGTRRQTPGFPAASR